jgi:hypothetical protein
MIDRKTNTISEEILARTSLIFFGRILLTISTMICFLVIKRITEPKKDIQTKIQTAISPAHIKDPRRIYRVATWANKSRTIATRRAPHIFSRIFTNFFSIVFLFNNKGW